ncbi:hypothetical protein G6F46_005731 [Rhizopus delemar]|uniref:Uncharacterized protein n=2 Tax=Rhizopus TaxID=4842 RepID=A0A9P7CQ55_9FUNG|nr:hypothetical protein G6F55_004252 [Rhizopus delemar]KAG1544868.1 hypothetical protein G6F51_005800 [Rhizopus arrhizus]KAG1498521.1 hypothetical protein G6F54_005023 [Rhizopus delemar]KAG1512322.1 hypothetical protein G6F53_005273 [Rhizopus delemar]KAG1527162.1 hypothetical protein G6F52_001778 [Rhizopus delemar]
MKNVPWKLGLLYGGQPNPCPKHHDRTLSKKHVIQCLHIHRRLQIPTTIEDPLSFLLNLLPQSQTTFLSIYFVLFRNPHYAPQKQIDLATAHADICKLQQENAFLRKQLAPKLPTTNIPPSLSERTISPTVSFPPCNPSIPSKCSSSPNNASTSPPKVARPECDNSQSSLTAIARQFSSPAKPTGLKLIHVLARSHLVLQQLRSNFRRLHINTRRILDIHYSDRNLVSFLTHIDYETEPCSQLSKFNIIVRNDFNPSIIRDPTLVNELIGRKVQQACKAFLHRICIVHRRFRTPIYNVVANFFVQSGFIDLEDLASYGLTSLCKYRTGHV